MVSSGCQTLATWDLPSASRVARWNDFGSETLSNMVVDPADRDGFDACITRRVAGDIGVAWMTTSPAVARGFGGGVGAWAAPSKDAFLLMHQERGHSLIRQHGRESVLAPGDMLLLDASRAHFTEVREAAAMMMVKLPTYRLVERVPGLDDAVARSLPACAGAVRVASSLLRTIRDALEREVDDGWTETAADVLVDAVAVAYRTGCRPQGADRRTAEQRQACAYIAAHFDDPELSVADIAKAINVSTRRLQRLFLAMGATPRQYVLDTRLNAAARELRRARGDGSITEIALRVGFNDLSYFARSFTRKHGLSPRRYRAAFDGRRG